MSDPRPAASALAKDVIDNPSKYFATANQLAHEVQRLEAECERLQRICDGYEEWATLYKERATLAEQRVERLRAVAKQAQGYIDWLGSEPSKGRFGQRFQDDQIDIWCNDYRAAFAGLEEGDLR